MARVNYTGFDTGDVIEASDSSNVSFSTTTRLNSSGYSLQVSPSSGGQSWYALGCISTEGVVSATPVGVFANISYTKFHVYFSSLPSVATEFFCVFSSDIVLPMMHLFINSSGTITVKDINLNTVATASSNVSASTWTRIEVYHETDGSTADVEVKINGTVVASVSGIDSFSFNADQWVVGRMNTSEATAYTMFVEDLVVDDAAYPGNTRIVLLTPNASGTYNDWTASAGTPLSCVDEIPNNGDTDFITGAFAEESSFGTTDTTGTVVAGSSSYKAVKAISVIKANMEEEV